MTSHITSGTPSAATYQTGATRQRVIRPNNRRHSGHPVGDSGDDERRDGGHEHEAERSRGRAEPGCHDDDRQRDHESSERDECRPDCAHRVSIARRLGIQVLEPRPGGGTLWRLRESGFEEERARSDNVDGWQGMFADPTAHLANES